MAEWICQLDSEDAKTVIGAAIGIGDLCRDVDERTELGLLSECPSLMKKVVDLLSYPSLQDRDQTTPPTVTSIPTVVPPVFTQKRLDIETQDLLRSKCARAVGNFVIDNDHNRGLLADAGGVPALLSTLSPPDTNTQAPLLSPSSLPSPQFHRMLATAAGAIGNLTCDTPKMAVKVADAGGLPRLVSVLDYLSSLLQQLHYPGDNSSNSSDSSSAIVCPVQNIQLPDDVSLLCTFIMRAIIHVADEPAIAKELVVALSLFQHMHTLFSYPSIHNDEAMLQELATCFTPLIFDHAALATKAGLSSTFLRGLLFTSDAINAAGSSATSRDDDSEDDFDEEMYHEIQQACIDCLVPLAQHEPNTIIPVLVDVTVGKVEGRYARCSLTTKIKALRALSALSALRSGEEDAAAAGDRTEGAKTKSITGAVGGRDGGNNPYGDVNGDVHDTKRREVKTAAPAATSTSTSTSGNGDHRHAATEGANDNCLCVGHHYFMEVLPDLIELAHSSSSSFPASPASPVSGGARPSRRLPIKARKEVRRRSLQVMGNLASSASNCTLLFNTPRFMQVVQLLQSESLELTAADKNDEGGNGRDSSVTPLLSSTVTATDSKSVEIITSIYRRLALSASVLPVLLEKHGVCRSLLHVLRIPVQRRPEILRAHYHALAALRTVLRFPSTHHHHQQYLSSSPRQASPSLLCSPSAVVVEAGGIAVLCSLLDSVMTRIQAEAARVLVAIILHSCPLTCTAYTTASKPSLCSSTSSSTVTGVANTGSTAAMRAASASADCLRDRICQSLLSLPASLSPLAHLCLLLESQHRLLHREALAAIDCLASLGVPPSPLSPVSPQISSSSSPVLGPLALAQHRLIARERGNDEKDATPVSSSSQIGAPTLSRPAAAEKETKKACQAPALLALIASRLEQEIEDSKRGGCAGDEMGADNHDTKRETNLQIPMLVSIIHNLIEFARSDAEHEVILLDVLPSSSPPSSSTPAQPSLVRRLLLACEELQSRSAGDCRHSAADMRMRHKTKLQVVVEALTERITSEKVCQ